MVTGVVTGVVTGGDDCLWLNEWDVCDIGSGGCVTEVLHSVCVCGGGSVQRRRQLIMIILYYRVNNIIQHGRLRQGSHHHHFNPNQSIIIQYD